MCIQSSSGRRRHTKVCTVHDTLNTLDTSKQYTSSNHVTICNHELSNFRAACGLHHTCLFTNPPVFVLVHLRQLHFQTFASSCKFQAFNKIIIFFKHFQIFCQIQSKFLQWYPNRMRGLGLLGRRRIRFGEVPARRRGPR